MLSIKKQIQWRDPLTNMQRFNQSIKGINGQNQIIELDIRNNITEKILSFSELEGQLPVINQVKFLETDYGKQYYYNFQKKIVTASGQIIDQSNSKADFVRGFDGKKDMFVFAKYHKNHNKYSVNAMKIGQQKKIVQLIDQKISKLHFMNQKQYRSILVETTDESVNLIHGQHWDVIQEMPIVNRFLTDVNYIYSISGSGRHSDNKNQYLDSFQTSRFNQKVKIEVFHRKNLVRGKGYSQFQFIVNRKPIKFDSFQNDIIVAFRDSLEIYDIRKLTKPFQKQNENNIKDFYYQPNLQRIFLSCQKNLLIYDYK